MNLHVRPFTRSPEIYNLDSIVQKVLYTKFEKNWNRVQLLTHDGRQSNFNRSPKSSADLEGWSGWSYEMYKLKMTWDSTLEIYEI
jgi:hypothetical protein